MNIDNITSDSMTLTYNGKVMLIKVYEEEIERLKEQLNDEIDDELKQSEIMVKKQEEIERLNNIINKAIEYLESYNTDFKNCRFGEAPISLRELGDLLDILKGSDKE